MAALGVVFAHLESFFGAMTAPTGLYTDRTQAWRIYNMLAHGEFFVTIFFVLSGFVLLVKFDRFRERSYLVQGVFKRYARLTPVALASTILAWLLFTTIGFHNEQAASLIGGHRWLHGLYGFDLTLGGAVYQGLWGIHKHLYGYNTVLWTISIELWGSMLLFCFAALFYESARYTAIVLAASIVLAGMIGEDGVYYALFLGGSLLLRNRVRISYLLLPVAIFLGIQNRHTDLVHWCDEFLAAHHVSLGFSSTVLFMAAGAMLLIPIILSTPLLSRILSCRPFVWLGEVSYPLYAVHMILIPSVGAAVMVQLSGAANPRLVVLAAYASVLAAGLVLAAALMKTVELPSRRLADAVGKSLYGALMARPWTETSPARPEPASR